MATVSLSLPWTLSGTEGSTGTAAGLRRGRRLGEDEGKTTYLTGGSRSSVRTGEEDGVLGSAALAWAGPCGERRGKGWLGREESRPERREEERGGEGVGQKGSPGFLSPFLFPFSSFIHFLPFHFFHLFHFRVCSNHFASRIE